MGEINSNELIKESSKLKIVNRVTSLSREKEEKIIKDIQLKQKQKEDLIIKLKELKEQKRKSDRSYTYIVKEKTVKDIGKLKGKIS